MFIGCGIGTIDVDVVVEAEVWFFELAFEHALGISGPVSDLDWDGTAFFGIFGCAFCLFALVEQDGFGLASGRRTCDRFCVVGALEVLTDATGGVVISAFARLRMVDANKENDAKVVG